jgi:hypothetical protein
MLLEEDWPDRRQKIDYEKDDEWVNFRKVALDALQFEMGTVVENIKMLNRSTRRSKGNSFANKSDLSELLLALRQAAKIIEKNVPLDSCGNVLRKSQDRPRGDGFQGELDALRESGQGIHGQGPPRT